MKGLHRLHPDEWKFVKALARGTMMASTKSSFGAGCADHQDLWDWSGDLQLVLVSWIHLTLQALFGMPQLVLNQFGQ